MAALFNLGNIAVDVSFKDIKNIHLSVNPPSGDVRVSAPRQTNVDTLRLYVISKLDWIKRQQKKFQEQERETPREYLERESHYLWGKRYLLELVENNSSASIKLKHSKILMHTRPGTSQEKIGVTLEAWYREQLREAITPLIDKWETILGLKVNKCFVRRMKTKWGSCNHYRKNIRINTELAKKPLECLEYIVVHEMLHFLIPCHNEQFIALMDKYLPTWKMLRQRLNTEPLSHTDWNY